MILPSITFVILLLNHCLCCSLYYMEGCHILYKYKLEFKNACQWLAYDICKMVWEGFDGKVWWWLCTRLGVEKTKRSMIFFFVCFHPSGIWCCVFLTDICCLLLFYTYLCYIDTSTLIVTRFLISWWSIWTMRKLFHYPCDISFCFYCLLAILCEFAWVEPVQRARNRTPKIIRLLTHYVLLFRTFLQFTRVPISLQCTSWIILTVLICLTGVWILPRSAGIKLVLWKLSITASLYQSLFTVRSI